MCASSLHLVFLLSSDDPGPGDPVAVEPSPCPSVLQDLAEPGPLEPEAAPVSRSGNTGCKAADDLFNMCFLHHMKPLSEKASGTIFEPAYVLYE